MFSSMVAKVWKELELIGFSVAGELSLVKMENNIWVFRLEENDESYLVKYYEVNDVRKIVEFCKELENLGIVSSFVVGNSNKIIVYKELTNCWRISEDDLKKEGVIEKLGKWYRTIHSVSNLSVDNYNDYFSLNSIKVIVEKFNLGRNPAIMYIYSNFDNIKLKLERLEKSVLYGKFSLEDVMVSSSEGVFILNFDNLMYGYRSADLNLVLESMDEKQGRKFLKAYGEVSKDELIIGKVVGCVINLYLASKEKRFPSWGRKSLEMVNDGKLLELAKILVEWY